MKVQQFLKTFMPQRSSVQCHSVPDWDVPELFSLDHASLGLCVQTRRLDDYVAEYRSGRTVEERDYRSKNTALIDIQYT